MHSFLHRFAKQSVSLSTVLLINIFLGLELANYICMGLLWLLRRWSFTGIEYYDLYSLSRQLKY